MSKHVPSSGMFVPYAMTCASPHLGSFNARSISWVRLEQRIQCRVNSKAVHDLLFQRKKINLQVQSKTTRTTWKWSKCSAYNERFVLSEHSPHGWLYHNYTYIASFVDVFNRIFWQKDLVTDSEVRLLFTVVRDGGVHLLITVPVIQCRRQWSLLLFTVPMIHCCRH